MEGSLGHCSGTPIATLADSIKISSGEKPVVKMGLSISPLCTSKSRSWESKKKRTKLENKKA